MMLIKAYPAEADSMSCLKQALLMSYFTGCTECGLEQSFHCHLILCPCSMYMMSGEKPSSVISANRSVRLLTVISNGVHLIPDLCGEQILTHIVM